MQRGGLPFDIKTKDAVDRVCLRVFDLDFAGMIIIDGGVGQGKTTLAVEIGDYIEGEEINFHEQLAMGGNDFKKKLQICYLKKKKVIIYDEAGDFNRRSVLTRFNGDLNRVFETFRAFKIVVILILPSFIDLDDSMFKKEIPRLLLHCYSRNKKIGRIRAYSLYRAFYVRNNMKKAIVKPLAYRQTPNFFGIFKNLPPERQQRLTDFSMEGKFKILKSQERRSQGWVTMKEIISQTGRNYSVVKRSLLALRIRSTEKEGKELVFSPDQARKIRDHLALTPRFNQWRANFAKKRVNNDE